MKAHQIQVGGTYWVRLAKDVDAQAELVRSRRPIPTGPGINTEYTARLTKAVGALPKGREFQVKARSVRRLVSAPPLPPSDLVPAPRSDEGALPPFLSTPAPPQPTQGHAGASTVLLTLRLEVPPADLVALLSCLQDYRPQVQGLAAERPEEGR
jgi:hypothetical protein